MPIELSKSPYAVAIKKVLVDMDNKGGADGPPITRDDLRDACRMLGVLPEDNFKYAFRDGLAALIKTGEVYDPANDPNGLEWERDIGLIVVRPLPVYMSEG